MHPPQRQLPHLPFDQVHPPQLPAAGRVRRLDPGVGDRTRRGVHRAPAAGAAGVVVAGAIWLYFRFSVLAGLEGATRLATLSLVLTLVISFLFAAVSAWAAKENCQASVIE